MSEIIMMCRVRVSYEIWDKNMSIMEASVLKTNLPV